MEIDHPDLSQPWKLLSGKSGVAQPSPRFRERFTELLVSCSNCGLSVMKGVCGTYERGVVCVGGFAAWTHARRRVRSFRVQYKQKPSAPPLPPPARSIIPELPPFNPA